MQNGIDADYIQVQVIQEKFCTNILDQVDQCNDCTWPYDCEMASPLMKHSNAKRNKGWQIPVIALLTSHS